MMRVLIGDSSAVSRSVQKDILRFTTRYEFCGDAISEKELFDKIKALKPHFLVVDADLFAGKRIENVFLMIKETKIPALVYVSKEYANYESPAGICTITKPTFINSTEENLKQYAMIFDQTIRKAEKELLFGDIEKNNPVLGNTSNIVSGKKFEAVCIGVSTGGPGTLQQLLRSFRPDFNLPIFITQHIDSFFDKNLITWLNNNSNLPVHLAEDNMQPLSGHVYFAPSDYHLTFAKNNLSNYVMKLNHDEPVCFLRPAVDKMFESATNLFKDKCIGVLLTGMGNDGANGCCQLKKAGSYTITQDEQSCVIYGMPKAAYDAGGSCEVLPLNKIAERVMQLSGIV